MAYARCHERQGLITVPQLLLLVPASQRGSVQNHHGHHSVRFFSPKQVSARLRGDGHSWHQPLYIRALAKAPGASHPPDLRIRNYIGFALPTKSPTRETLSLQKRLQRRGCVDMQSMCTDLSSRPGYPWKKKQRDLGHQAHRFSIHRPWLHGVCPGDESFPFPLDCI